MKAFRVVAWKELLDLSRDYKTIVAVVVVPLVALPGLAILTGLLYQAQEVSVLIVYEEEESRGLALWLMEELSRRVSAGGVQALISVAPEPGVSDVVVVLPRGFYYNLTSLDRSAVVEVSLLAGSQAAEVVASSLNSILAGLSERIALERIGRLAEMAGVDLDPGSVMRPIVVSRVFHAPGGEPVGGEDVLVAYTARILEFSLFFVVNPAVIFMTDSIIGERERRTLEKLLVAPINRVEVLAGKMAASFALGMAAAIADSIGVLIFFFLALGSLRVSMEVAVAWALSIVLLVLMTSALVSMIASRSESIRAAQSMSFLVLMTALAVYFAALAVDLSKVSPTVSLAMQLIPFTHAALVIHSVALGEYLRGALHLAILAGFWVLMLAASVRAFDSERLIMAR